MKLKNAVLRFATEACQQHILPDLHYAERMHSFRNNRITSYDYLEGDYGFKKFLSAYGVGRTIKGGDDNKLNILNLFFNHKFGDSHPENILTLASILRQHGYSSGSSKAGPGLPQSFCSKLLYVLRPDELIPYDAYVLHSLEKMAGRKIKSLADYYTTADGFRQTYFHHENEFIRELLKSQKKTTIQMIDSLQLRPAMLISWKMADKYLWCEDYLRRKRTKD